MPKDKEIKDTDAASPDQPQAARRRLLAALTASGAAVTAGTLASPWSRPSVDAVLLPAHAQATLDSWFGTVSEDSVGSTNSDLLDMFVSRAEARPSYTVAICVSRTETGAFISVALFEDGEVDRGVRFDGPVPVNGVPTALAERYGEDCEAPKGSETLASILMLGDVAVGQFKADSFGVEVDFEIGPGSCTLSATPPDCPKEPKVGV